MAGRSPRPTSPPRSKRWAAARIATETRALGACRPRSCRCRTCCARHGVAALDDPAQRAQELGLRVAETSGSVQVKMVLRGGAAEQAGFSANDEWIGIELPATKGRPAQGWRLARLDDLALYLGPLQEGHRAGRARPPPAAPAAHAASRRDDLAPVPAQDAAKLSAWLATRNRPPRRAARATARRRPPRAGGGGVLHAQRRRPCSRLAITVARALVRARRHRRRPRRRGRSGRRRLDSCRATADASSARPTHSTPSRRSAPEQRRGRRRVGVSAPPARQAPPGPRNASSPHLAAQSRHSAARRRRSARPDRPAGASSAPAPGHRRAAGGVSLATPLERLWPLSQQPAIPSPCEGPHPLLSRFHPPLTETA